MKANSCEEKQVDNLALKINITDLYNFSGEVYTICEE